ncbi:triosephosphate isomerase [Campylobacterota bacterium]|nr:triosephosphate isomerase [Campylobacterota bacterium]GHV02995.1 triosephosphate isomerase [Campylobacterota bacterium]
MIIAANLKTNHNRTKTAAYLDTIEEYIKEHKSKDRAVVFPSMSSLCPSRERITIGAQNAYPVANGSFTGEIGTDHLDELAIRTLLIGHSERRHILNEDIGLIKRKFDFFAELGYEIFFCVGEPLEIKETGFESVLTYINRQLDGIDLTYPKLVLAYEPVWAIGTGKTATKEDIIAVHSAIKELSDKPLLYGGSVKVENAAEILAIDGVDGVLVGTTSWQADKYNALLASAQTIKE